MNKSALVERLAQTRGITATEAKMVVATVLEDMARTLAGGGRVEIRGFGTLTIRVYDAYIGHNPKTGEVIKVESKRLPFFKAGKELRQRVNGDSEDS